MNKLIVICSFITASFVTCFFVATLYFYSNIMQELHELNNKIDGIVMFLDLDLNTECETQE